MPCSYLDFNMKLFSLVFYYIHKAQIYNSSFFHNYQIISLIFIFIPMIYKNL